MAQPAMTALATVTLSGSDTQVLFSNIPNTYKDLLLVFVASGSGDENLTPTINGSSANFIWRQMTTTSASGSSNSIGRVSTTQTSGVLEFLDYADTNKYKHFFVRTDVGSSEVRQLAAQWQQTTAINSIGLAIQTGYSFNTGGYFSLYGIAG